jgi:L-ascorbate metabolism protein UlaG (beta-lactamase superfamily)
MQPAHPGPDGYAALTAPSTGRGIPAPVAAAGAAVPASSVDADARSIGNPRDARDAAAAPAVREAPLPRRIELPAPIRTMMAVPAEGSVTLVGEATVLIRSHGLTVLTDPNFLRRGERARLAFGLGTPRRADPAIDLDELPPIDVVVLSRLREDHFDRIARRRLPRDVPIVAPAAVRGELVAMGFSSVHALPAWGALRVARGDTWVQLTATPTRPGPPLLGALLPPSSGTLMEFGRDEDVAGYRIWVSGDTTVDDALLGELRPRLAGLDLALLHVGGASTLGLGGAMDESDGVRLLKALGPRTAIPLRLDDFGPRPPAVRAIATALRGQTIAAGPAAAPTVRLLDRGDVFRFAPLQHWALATDDTVSWR